MRLGIATLGLVVVLAGLSGCGEEADEGSATVSVMNDFNNPNMAYQPPWTICESYYLGVEFGHIDLGETSVEQDLIPGLGYVLMVAAWNDPDCNPMNCLPIASRNEEEVVDGQTRTVTLNMPNHQGPCPPEGIEPIPQELYEEILALWPEYDFLPYDRRTENAQCLD